MDKLNQYPNQIEEQWKSIPGFKGFYQVSNLGRVRSLKRIVKVFRKGVAHVRVIRGRTLKQHKDVNFLYMHVVLHAASLGKKFFSCQIHTLVLQAFVGPCPQGMECCHKDCDPTNNKLSNLRWDTPKNNYQDSVANGYNQHGENNPCSKLNEQQVLEIKRLRLRKISRPELAKRYSVSVGTIARIDRGETWTHIL